jgi:outer membrane lipopolysaccharide assembly protein LptE/RlpB
MAPPRKSTADTPSDPTEDATQPALDADAVAADEPGSDAARQDVAAEGALVVDVAANLSLAGGQVLEVNQTGVTVPDTAEVRDCIAQGYLLLRD